MLARRFRASIQQNNLEKRGNRCPLCMVYGGKSRESWQTRKRTFNGPISQTRSKRKSRVIAILPCSILVRRSHTMRKTATCKMLWLSAISLLAIAVAAGCHSTSPSLSSPLAHDPSTAHPKKTHVQPGMELDWALRSTGSDQPNLVRAGRAIVAADGTLALGPYGSA